METSSATVKDSLEEKKPETPAPQPTVIQSAAAQPSPFKGTVREEPVSGASSRRYPKATVREIPAALKSDDGECWRLIPVESPDSEVILMKPGEIISIGNRRYKFQK